MAEPNTSADPGQLAKALTAKPNWFTSLFKERDRISTRLVLCFAGSACITLVASAVALIFFAFQGEKLQQVNEENVPRLITAFEVAQEGAVLAAALPRLRTATLEDFAAIKASVQDSQVNFKRHIDLLMAGESGQKESEEIQEAGAGIDQILDETISLVEERFVLQAAFNEILMSQDQVYRQIAGVLTQMIDDQLFFAMTGFRSLDDSQPNSTGVDAHEFNIYRALSEIEYGIEQASEIIGAVAVEDDADQLVPKLEVFEATRSKVSRSAMLFPQSEEMAEMLALVQQLMNLGEGPEGVFVVRRQMLELIAKEEQLTTASRELVAALYASGEEVVGQAAMETDTATQDAFFANTLAVYMLIALNLVAIVGVIVIVRVVVLRRLASRVEVLADRMFEMADGNLEIEIPQEGKDEIAHMAAALEVFRLNSLEALRLNEVERLNKELSKTNEQLEQTNADLKTAQQQIVMREKLAAMGELTAGVAHEIKNPLNFMMNFAEVSSELLEELFEELDLIESERDKETIDEIKDDLSGNFKIIQDHGERANSIVRDMLAMGRESTDWVPTDVNRLLSEHARLAFHSTRAANDKFQMDIVEEFAEDVPQIQAVQADLGRVFLNMFMNACYAVDKRQQDEESGYDPTLTIRTGLKGDRIDVQIEDNGVGIPQDKIEKIFQPFFTTKPTDEGTGLGLALAADIIRAHGGSVRVESEVNRFTRMIVDLPCEQTAELPQAATS